MARVTLFGIEFESQAEADSALERLDEALARIDAAEREALR